MTESQFPDYLGLVGLGDEVVLPSPLIESDWNLRIRDYEDRTFRWGLVTGAYPDPDLGYTFNPAASYRIEITPDVGLVDADEMFTAYNPTTGKGNGRLRILEGLTLGVELTDQGDESVTYQIPIEDMYRILAPGFDRYLWRVMGVDDEGQEGHPSALQRFRGRVVVPSVSWTVDTPTEPPRSLTYTLTGTRTSTVTSIEINDTEAWTTYPSPESWQAEVPLDGGRNVFFVRAFDALGNGSEYRQVEVSTSSETMGEGKYFNRFDDFGYQMSLPRLPGERNASYRGRLKDVVQHKASSLYDGLMNAFGRELDLGYIDQGLLLRAAISPERGTRLPVRIWSSSTNFYVQTERMFHRQRYARPEGNTWRVELEEYPTDNVVVEQPIGTILPHKQYVLEEDDGRFWIRFLFPDHALTPVYLSYAYAKKISKHGRTVAEVVADLTAIQHEGVTLLEVTQNASLTGTESANGFMKFTQQRLDLGPWNTAGQIEVTEFPVRWMEAELCPFLEDDMRTRYLNQYGSLFGTQYSGWAMRAKAELHTTWGFLIADKNLWSHPQLTASGVGDLPTHWDMFTGSWITTGQGPSFSSTSAWPRGFIHPGDSSLMDAYGIPRLLMYSGIGDSHDLYFLVEDGSPIWEPALPSTIFASSGGTNTTSLGLGVGGP